MTTPDVRVLIVCMGNICRSPMGEAVLRHVAVQRGNNIFVDSAGTGAWHVGEEADDRTIAVCRQNKVPIHCRARKVQLSDFTEFTHILAADNNNLQSLERMKPHETSATVRLWGSYLDNEVIPDPYYGGSNGFHKVFDQCVALSHAFLDDVFGVTE
ncbi:phosphotyrosine protein phosphatase [Fistulina hepatica ATCC 64428]|uniref:Phosphotyrosine protein phosphatase n=1 Tax=Fistulina hepatica ATCC 64428 TaxID=1128425 RepID=A0A0D7A3Z9_9AGAR|nr:phosphotyrosine protein phosphatase [Fistulina hepatica ATCC 64428]